MFWTPQKPNLSINTHHAQCMFILCNYNNFSPLCKQFSHIKIMKTNKLHLSVTSTYNRYMKYLYYILCAIIPTHLIANPMFGHNSRNTIGIYIGQSTSQGDLGHLVFPWDWRISPMTLSMIQYSQPISLLRMPARINVHALQNFGYASADGTSFGAIGISWDIAFISICDFYIGAGLGPYMRDSGDKYVSSRLVFGERVFIGYKISEHLNAELFTLHFSNGDFTQTNQGFNFIGLGINYSF